ncbi:MAG: hypothetical protein V5A45_07950 [Haloarculaceae archaeon]
MERSTALDWGLLVAGLLLLTGPLVVQPQAPPDTIEYSVDSDWDPVDRYQTLQYANFSETERDIFERANASNGSVTVTAANSPERFTPPPDVLGVYNVEQNGSTYLLQTTHFTHEVDLWRQVVPRVLASVAGLVLLLAVGYRRFT